MSSLAIKSYKYKQEVTFRPISNGYLVSLSLISYQTLPSISSSAPGFFCLIFLQNRHTSWCGDLSSTSVSLRVLLVRWSLTPNGLESSPFSSLISLKWLASENWLSSLSSKGRSAAEGRLVRRMGPSMARVLRPLAGETVPVDDAVCWGSEYVREGLPPPRYWDSSVCGTIQQNINSILN